MSESALTLALALARALTLTLTLAVPRLEAMSESARLKAALGEQLFAAEQVPARCQTPPICARQCLPFC